MRYCLLVLLSLCLCCCQISQPAEVAQKNYKNDIGDIPFDSHTDRKDFQICDSTKMSTSRRGLAYLGGNGSVERACFEKFVFKSGFESFSGFVTIRFIINCRQESDRYRAQSMDFDFIEKDCPDALTDHLIQLVSELNEWQPSASRYEGIDFSKYLNFKIENGRITAVLQ